jgi:hypothetical protein
MTQSQLTDAQRAILAQAAAVEDGGADAFEGDARTVAGLIRRGLMMRVPTVDGPGRVLVTTAGQALLGGETAQAPAATPRRRRAATLVPASAIAPPQAAVSPAASEPKAPGGKLGTLIALLQRPDGATLEQLASATGWQAHSVRGAISGALKKQRGIDVTSKKVDGVRVYRVAGAGA